MAKVKHMRCSTELEKLLYIINYERVIRSLKPLNARQFTAKIAKKYINNTELIHDDFIKIP